MIKCFNMRQTKVLLCLIVFGIYLTIIFLTSYGPMEKFHRIFVTGFFSILHTDTDLKYLNTTAKLSYVQTVVILWCKNESRSGYFEFKNYLSVVSAIKYLNPNSIDFYFDVFPAVDSLVYNTWLQEIMMSYPYIIPQKLKDPSTCKNINNKTIFIRKILSSNEGVYINLNTMLTDTNQNFKKNYSTTIGDAYIIYSNYYINNILTEDGNITCLIVDSLNGSDSILNSEKCVYFKTYFSPSDIWELDNKLGRYVREVFYDNPSIKSVPQSYEDLTPNIGHTVYFHGEKMRFMQFLSLLSAIHIGKLDYMYIHGDKPFTGKYAELLRKEKKIVFTKRAYRNYVFNQSISKHAHFSDVIRLDVLKRYGGLYMDTDAIMVKPLSLKQRSYDAVISRSANKWSEPFPAIFSNGIMLGKAGKEFYKKVQQSFRNFRNDIHAWSGNMNPYKLKERQPELVQIDSHLVIECYALKCLPTYWPGYKDIDRINHLSTKSITDWKNDTNFFHWTWPEPKEYADPAHLLKNNGTLFGQIGIYVLQKSGYYEYFKNELKGLVNETVK